MAANKEYLRYKLSTVSADGDVIEFIKGGAVWKTVVVLPLSICNGKRVLKYLNKNGEYRFYAFSNYYEEIERPKEIGMINNIVTSILNSKASSKSVGYKSERILNLKSELVPTAHLEMLRDIYTSPRVYLYVGTTTDTENDWVLVSIKANKSIRKEAKAKFSQIDIEVTLPETYSITML